MANDSCKDCKNRHIGCHADCDKYTPKTYEYKQDEYLAYLRERKGKRRK